MTEDLESCSTVYSFDCILEQSLLYQLSVIC